MVQQQSNSSSHTLALCAGAGACFLAGWTAHAAFRSGWRPRAHHDASSRRQPAHLMPTHVSGGDTPSQSPSVASTPRGGYPASLTEQNGHKMALLVRTDITLVSKRVPSPQSPAANTAHTPDGSILMDHDSAVGLCCCGLLLCERPRGADNSVPCLR